MARIAGVGTTTVSRVINGGDRVAPEMLAHVRKVMEELGYEPNQAARALKSARSKTIGLIIPSIVDPFFAEFASVVELMAREKDYAVIFLTSHDRAERGMADLKILERHRADGLLIVPPRTGSKALLDQLTQLGVPVVAFDRPLIGRNCSRILCGNFPAAEIATKHLIDHGRKRILVLGGDPRLHTIQQRLEGYEKAIGEAGLEPIIEMDASDYASAEAAITRRIKQKGGIDAIFGLYNQSTIRAYEVLQNRNIRVPDEISLIGFDDFALASTLRPSITVMRQNITEMAQTATRLLLQHMNGEVTSPQQIEIEAHLIVRQSCGFHGATSK
ncbi:LacI family DNA-binding transcriptional regulator [Granulicella cerasi]|uniref:LacI family DNA-binding transcriptional regulator n=1 Tax=Granulicella cerasi TaxID=741063 RepID=A0ABW1Z671_9BACT|nr:LacI family DNA-binding transcriptional regulator [Granulicella cerasi]